MLRSLIFIVLLGACGQPAAEAEVEAEAEAEEGIWGQEVPGYSPTGGVGSPCRTHMDCDDDRLHCDLSQIGSSGVGICTAQCTDGTPEEETAACGDGGTCLSSLEGGAGFCTATCDAAADPGEDGACPANQACLGFSLYGAADERGCYPFCHDDSGCGPYESCDARIGACVSRGTAERPGLLPDGAPCDPMLYAEDGRSAECRGTCMPVGQDAFCASYVDLAVQQSCLDDPERMAPLAWPDDNLGLCIFQQCERSDDCSEGTSCRFCPGGGLCCQP